jgi:hypothetical protein
MNNRPLNCESATSFQNKITRASKFRENVPVEPQRGIWEVLILIALPDSSRVPQSVATLVGVQDELAI